MVKRRMEAVVRMVEETGSCTNYPRSARLHLLYLRNRYVMFKCNATS
jgi:hypothetical protein